ncbi:MAG TPA: ribose 5-phosphate isomerase B [bacterium]|nr:ribose 5-phosphate isomerase B [bacterium]
MNETFGKRIERVVESTFGGDTSRGRRPGERRAEERLPGSGTPRLRIALGSDHRGATLKRQLAEYLRELGHMVVDCGAREGGPSDYPDIALGVAGQVVQQACDFGIVIDAVGVGSAIAANKVRGIRAAPCYDVEAARSSRLHNDANVLTLGANFLNRGLARRIVREWLTTPFEGGRHVPRLEKIGKIEKDGLDARL